MRLFCIILLLTFNLAAVSQETIPSLRGYLKVSAELYFANSGSSSPVSAGYIGRGAMLGSYVAVGADLGVYKLKEFKRPFIPIGAQVSIGNFDPRKISPILQFGCYYPIHRDTESDTYSTPTSTITSVAESRGALQWKFSGGILVTSGEAGRIIITAGLTEIYMTTKVATTTITNGDAQTLSVRQKAGDRHYTLSFAFMLN